MQFPKELINFKKEIDKELKKYLSKKINESKKYGAITAHAVEQIADLTLRGGKRVRSALLYYSYLAHGGKNKKGAMIAAMSMELAETYLLIHDDIMDDDMMRRNGITVHTYFKKQSKNEQFGDSMGILSGDLASAYSYELIQRSAFDDRTINAAMKLLNDTYILEYFGQMLDIDVRPIDKMSEDDVLNIPRYKTAPYTFDSPVKIGAVLANKPTKYLSKLEKYSYPLGIVYQLQDDILGVFGDEKITGKPVGNDIREGKKTILVYYALENCKSSEKKIIKSCLGNKQASREDIEKVKSIIVSTGALDKTRSLAQTMTLIPKKFIDKTDLIGEGKKFLVDIATAILTREY